MQMELFIVDDLRLLMEKQEEWCVSLFMPTHKVTPLAQENQIRFKNLFKEAEEKLATLGADLPLDRARRLLDDKPFWHQQSNGMALFIANDFFRTYRLPIAFEELVVVTDRFHVKPVLPLLTGDGRFYVLALSQNDVRLLQCSRYSVSEVDLGTTSQSLAEALKLDEPEKVLQFHTRTASVAGKRGAMFHGHGVGHDDAKDRILRFFQQLDRGLRRLLGNEQTPMVVAAVEYLVPIFKQAASYPFFLDHLRVGNPEGMPMQELHAKAMEIVGPHFEQEIRDQTARYESLALGGKTSNDMDDIVKAACHGRVDVLFVAVGVQCWGSFDTASEEVKRFPHGRNGGYDLLDYAATQTLMNSGTVYAFPREQMPHEAPVAAIYRY
jgi:hypothetical protein